MLHLDAGIHLHKVEMLSVAVQQKFHSACALVVDGLRRFHGSPAHLLPQLRRQAPGGGFLNELLVPALDGAVPVSQVDDVALAVRQDLKFNVPGFQHQLFQIHFIVSEAGVGLRFGGGVSVGQVFSAVAAADTPAAASGAGLQQNGIAHRLRHGQSVLHGEYRAIGAGGHRHPGGAHQVPGGGFGAGLPDGVPGGTDEGDAVFRAGVGKFRVFRQEPVAGVQTVAAGGYGGGEQRLRV